MTDAVWKLKDFLLRFDEWVRRDDPPADWQLATMAWIHSRQSDPYRGATPRFDLGPRFWFAEVPGIEDDRFGVFSLYAIDDGAREAHCSTVATLRRPAAW